MWFRLEKFLATGKENEIKSNECTWDNKVRGRVHIFSFSILVGLFSICNPLDIQSRSSRLHRVRITIFISPVKMMTEWYTSILESKIHFHQLFSRNIELLIYYLSMPLLVVTPVKRRMKPFTIDLNWGDSCRLTLKFRKLWLAVSTNSRRNIW